MHDDRFELECDRLSKAVDSVQYERIRWAKNEGPMLDRMAQLAQAAVAGRADFELTDEGPRTDLRRYVIKVHGTRVVAVSLGLAEGRRLTVDFPQLDEAWMNATLGAVIAEAEPIQP